MWVVVAIIAIIAVGAAAFLLGTSRSTDPQPAPGPTAVAVPDVVGLPEAEAANTLVAAGFQVKATADGDAGRGEAGTVYKQSPKAGEQAEPGSIVRVHTVPLAVTVPDLRGMSETEATNLLLQAGLRVGKTRTENSTAVKGQVLNQEPAAGASVEKDSTIDLVLASGNQPVPDVIGDTEAAARAALSAAGFAVESATRPTDDPLQDGVVTAVDPAAGKTAPVGSTVVLTIGTYTPSPAPEPVPSS